MFKSNTKELEGTIRVQTRRIARQDMELEAYRNMEHAFRLMLSEQQYNNVPNVMNKIKSILDTTNAQVRN